METPHSRLPQKAGITGIAARIRAMDYSAAPRRRSRSMLVPALVLISLAAGWCAFWFYASVTAKDAIAGWLEREAKAGRVYGCGEQTVGGFPFRIEVRCADARAEFRNLQSPSSLKASEVLVAAQIYQPTLLIGEISGPLTIADPGRPAKLTANWSLAQVSIRGNPRSPERVSLVLDNPATHRTTETGPERIFSGKHAELHGRLASGSINDRPVIDIALRLDASTAPTLHPMTANELDVEADATLHGLKDFSPKTWPQRFRELQEAGGRIEVRSLRIKQGDALGVAAGTLSLTPQGRLNGELQMTVAGLDKVLPSLGVDQLTRPGSAANERLGAALSVLDKLAPGLGNAARGRAGAGLAAGVALIGEPTDLEGRRAVRLPLKFSDGEVQLGPFRIGQTGPLF